jgi:hypothetical protein
MNKFALVNQALWTEYRDLGEYTDRAAVFKRDNWSI